MLNFGSQDRGGWLLLGVALATVIGAFLLPRIPQDPRYHEFADARTFLGLRNFWNVLSNLAFVVVGAVGLGKYPVSKRAGLHPSYLVCCVAIVGLGLCSARYHLEPNTWTLVWDRLAMALVIAAALAMVVGDRIGPTLGKRLLWPLAALGAGSVLYWRHSELQGAGDLRFYGVTQFLPLALLAVILCSYRARCLRNGYLWMSLGAYALAKVAEHFDRWFYDAFSHVMSGHTLKHLLAAGSLCFLIGSLRDGRTSGRPESSCRRRARRPSMESTAAVQEKDARIVRS